MQTTLVGKTAIVTGGSRGIGKAIALKLAQMGANIVLNASANSTDIDVAYDEFKSLGFNVVASKGSIADAAYVETMVSEAVASFGSLDILVNNAGITKDTFLIKMTEEDWDSVVDTNLKGAFLCTKAAAKVMLKQKKGKIINITSIVGETGNSCQANYASSKAGMIGLTKSVAKELAARGITCNAVAPGFIESKMTDKLPEQVKQNYLETIPLKRLGTTLDVANVVGFLASDDTNYITGQVINVDGGLVM